MAADLTTTGFFQRRSVILQNDHVVVLEHQSTKDRVRRIAFDRIEHVVLWRSLPWVYMVVYGLLLGGPGLAFLAVRSTPIIFIGLTLVAITVIIEARYLYMGKTSIRITRAGSAYVISGVVSPRKVDRFISRMEEAIHRAQQTQIQPQRAIASTQETTETDVGPVAPRSDAPDTNGTLT